MSELNMEFATPTVNYYMSAPDFVKFCENLRFYMSQNLTSLPKGRDVFEGHPVCMLGDILLHAVHYKTFEEFNDAWERRKTRLNYNRIFVIFSDRDGFTPSLLERIEKIPYRKVLFSNRMYDGFDFVFKINGYENEPCVGNLSAFRGITGKRIYSDFPFAEKFREMLNE